MIRELQDKIIALKKRRASALSPIPTKRQKSSKSQTSKVTLSNSALALRRFPSRPLSWPASVSWQRGSSS